MFARRNSKVMLRGGMLGERTSLIRSMAGNQFLCVRRERYKNVYGYTVEGHLGQIVMSSLNNDLGHGKSLAVSAALVSLRRCS